MARLLDTVPAFDAFAKAAALESPFIREQLWRDRYEAAHADVFAAFHAGDVAPRRSILQLRELARVREQARDGSAALPPIIDEVDEAVRLLLGAPQIPAPIHVLVVGDGAVNASVGILEDEVAVFHCLEWFRTPEDWRVLAAHETAHAWHEILLGVAAPTESLAWTTFSEGLAVRASVEAVPGRPESDYFWYGHAGFDAWLAWCHQHSQELRADLRDRLDDPAETNALFGSGRHRGHSRTGYFIAAELVTTAAMPLAALARLSVPEGAELIRSTLRS